MGYKFFKGFFGLNFIMKLLLVFVLLGLAAGENARQDDYLHNISQVLKVLAETLRNSSEFLVAIHDFLEDVNRNSP
ncbi:unnamed protein product [Notodromas monacha]|uniref:Uncharacterized protein n=1 Tax=Notodromas monacha TaxID=399045 RepID=A0A7R9BML2_9CRUS|nr:unnamed protein product [Notodromas monacha]CAG0918282.1 unnamed protein product [Notodromas monacha]